MSMLRIAGFVLLVFCLVACTTVTTPDPIGEKAVALDAAEWVGLWRIGAGDESQACRIDVVDADKGRIRLVWIEGDSEPKLETLDVQIREGGHAMFASAPEDVEADEPQRYAFALLRHEPGMMLAWLPDEDTFREAVRNKALPGADPGEKDNVLLGRLEPAHLDAITTDTAAHFWRWRDPLVFTRMQ